MTIRPLVVLLALAVGVLGVGGSRQGSAASSGDYGILETFAPQSATVRLYRTANSGSSWTLVSRTGLYDTGSTQKALPYECDKTITFTSPTLGWASSFCNGGPPFLYRSTDGGADWYALARVPLPK